MELNRYEIEMLRQHRQFHIAGTARPSFTNRGFLMAMAMILYFAFGGSFLLYISLPAWGGGMLGFAVGVAYMMFARWRFVGKVWPTMEHIIDWDEVESLLDEFHSIDS